MKVLSRADVVLALGSRLGPFGVLPQYGFDYWPASAKLIQVDADAKVLGLVKKTSVTVNGDARERPRRSSRGSRGARPQRTARRSPR
jgi:sulfoacetaldehyde acetyltransferase